MAAALNQQFSTLAAMTVDGIVGWKITELARSSSATNMPKAMDTMLFLDSFCRCVLPILRPFPQPNSVLICGAHPRRLHPDLAGLTVRLFADNATLHHDEAAWLEKLVETAGAMIIYLPPYACDLCATPPHMSSTPRAPTTHPHTCPH